jgi:hypothetical protein
MPLRPRGGVVTQRSAKPFTPVQFRAWPPALSEIRRERVNVKSTEKGRWGRSESNARARLAGGKAGRAFLDSLAARPYLIGMVLLRKRSRPGLGIIEPCLLSLADACDYLATCRNKGPI